jgi:AraC family transcriptional regulator
MAKRLEIPSRIGFSGDDLGLPFVITGGFDSFSKPISLEEHTHPGYEITYVFDGRVAWQLKSGALLILNGGDMAITRPMTPHRGFLNIIQPASIFWIVVKLAGPKAFVNTPFSRDDLNAIDKLLSSAGNTVCSGYAGIRDELGRLHTALREYGNAGKGGELIHRARVRSLICAFLSQAVFGFKSRPSRQADTYTAAACAYMRDHLREDIDTQAITKHLGISASRFFCVFRENAGITPNDYLQRLRIDTACGMLATGNLPITTIAIDLGFATSQYFAQCFKKYTGMKPVEYRKKCIAKK